ncbi:MAG: hypothetical protein AABX48_03890 [Nanoarchaeota archaeon]
MAEAIVDLEAHLTDTQDIVWSRSGKYVQDWDKKDFVPRVINASYNTSRIYNVPPVLSVTGFDDRRARKFRDLVEKESSDIGHFELDKNLSDDRMLKVIIPNSSLRIYFLAGQEIASDIGHITLAGLPFDYYLDTSDRRNLDPEKIFSEAEKYNAIVLIEAGRVGMLEKIFGKTFNKLVDKQGAEISAYDENLKKFKNYIDAVKSDNYVAGFPTIAVSDSHVPDGRNGPFSSYVLFNDVDFSSGEKLVASLKRGLASSHDSNIRNEKSVYENLRHAGICFGVGAVGMRYGLMKRDH